MRLRKCWIGWIVVGIAILALTPSYVRAIRVGGASDAPTYLLGDLALIYKAAYDLRLPYTSIVLFSHSDPERGEVVLYQAPDSDAVVFKRVVGVPGDRLEMRENHLIVNGTPLRYEAAAMPLGAEEAARNRLGQILEREEGAGPPHLISFTRGEGVPGDFGPVIVPAGRYFMMGDNRWNSLDSRQYGPIPRSRILAGMGRPFGRSR